MNTWKHVFHESAPLMCPPHPLIINNPPPSWPTPCQIIWHKKNWKKQPWILTLNQFNFLFPQSNRKNKNLSLSLSHSLLHSFTLSLLHSFTLSLLHSFTPSLLHSFTPSKIKNCIQGHCFEVFLKIIGAY